MKPVTRKARSKKTTAAIADEWDAIASQRDRQIRTGADISYSNVLVPTVLRLMKGTDRSRVIDVGCGTGVLTEILGRHAGRVVGVDLSANNIGIARASRIRPPNVDYHICSIEDYSSRYRGRKFGLAVGNMLLQDANELSAVLRAIALVLTSKGKLVLTLTHPWFWPYYWGYAKKKWFRYDREISVEAAFTISKEKSSLGITTHFHRPLEQYFNALSDAGFSIDTLMEPMPIGKIQMLYPQLWRFPRFLALGCSKH